MLKLEDYKKSRVYKETRDETYAEVIEKMSKKGLSAEDIAQILDMSLDVVKKALKKKPKK